MERGFYVDVGCFHPIKWSNTYMFYLDHWRGICIDPNSDFVPLWSHFRPHDRFLNIGISETQGEVSYIKDATIPQENYLRTASNALKSREGQATQVVTRRLD